MERSPPDRFVLIMWEVYERSQSLLSLDGRIHGNINTGALGRLGFDSPAPIPTTTSSSVNQDVQRTK